MTRMRRRLFPALCTSLAFWTGFAGPAAAQGREVTFIRDTEIESTIADYASPIFEAAGLDPESVTINLVRDSSLNAFVAGGQRLFIHTGLLVRSGRPNQVIGVIAHEAGHIDGGHLAQLQDALRQATAKSIVALVLGTAAGLAAGDAGAAGAIILGGQQVAQRQLFAYSRGQESSADAAALNLLDRTGQSATGLVEFLDVLAREQAIVVGRQDPYTSTHPLTSDRRQTVLNHVALSRYSENRDSPDLIRRHERMRAKLIGFLGSYEDTLKRYPETDSSVPARYARAIALFRRGDLAPALDAIDSLLAESPDDPYFNEVKGQMLFENGRLTDALQWYERAVELVPDAALIRTDLARLQLELNDPALVDTAKANLRAALQAEPTLEAAWRAMAVAQGRAGATGEMALALAEASLLNGDRSAAEVQAARAAEILPVGSPGWLRAQDLEREIERRRDR